MSMTSTLAAHWSVIKSPVGCYAESVPDEEFQRARRPEQVEARRAAILDAALELLAERRLDDISLRELSARVGLAKSNVLRYFDSREAIFLEILDRTVADWLESLEIQLSAVRTRRRSPYARETAVASAIAMSMVENPLLCELTSSMTSILERNVTVGFARTFKSRMVERNARLAGLVRTHVPALTPDGADRFARWALVILAGMWPYSQPTPAVEEIRAELGEPPAHDAFVESLTEALTVQLIGLVARGS
jgi:AcrR family transcriptional regulator